MRPMKRVLLAVGLSLLVACGGAAAPSAAPPAPTAPAPAPAIDELDKPLPLDARVTKGKLENGLTYYVLPHKKPEKRAQVWLAVNAGSILEDDDQRGLAHFVEHMGFNGTKRFPKQQLVDFIEKSGVRFGADLNAYTSFDETVYQLQVPTDDQALMSKAFEVLRDWADGITFDPAEVEKERGVVLEEWRLGRGAGMRVFDKQAPIVFKGSRYPERLPIGKPEIIKGAPRDTLVRFYKDWYRPDLMAVIAVGDFAPAEVEARIKSEFASLKGPAKPRERAMSQVPPHAETLVTIETDPELTGTSVGITSKMPHRFEETARDFRRSLAERLFNGMLTARLDEIRRQPNAPFLNAGSQSSTMVRTADAFRQFAAVKEDAVERGFGALLEEVLRVERHGFTQTELDRARSVALRTLQQIVKEYDKQDSRSFAAEITRNYFQREAMAGPEAELALVEKFLPTISLAELNQLGKTLGAGSRVISVSGPPSMIKPAPDALLALGKSVAARDIKPYEDATSNEPLMARAPTPGKITSTKTIGEVGVTEWKLSNGARVVVRPTTFANDDVRFSAFSPGGHSLAKDADFDSARLADTIVAQGGLGSFDAVKLRKSLMGKIASVSARVGELDEGFSGHAAPSDLELLLQMVHLSFTAPRRDEAAFASWRTREIEAVKNRRLSPEGTFGEDLTIFQTQNHLRRRPLTAEAFQRMDLDKALAFYKDRFADAGDFTFLFVGNVEVDRLKPLVETYLASLPSKARKETWKDPKVAWPAGVQTKTVVKGTEPKASVSLTFHGVETWSRDTENDMRMLGEVLSMRLREILREDLGGVYGVSAGGGIHRRPHPEYTFSVRFGCSPENVDKLKDAIFAEVKAIQDKGIGEEYIAKIKAQRKRAYETNLTENAFWLRELERAYTFGDDPKLTILDAPPALADKVSSDRVKAAAKKYLSPKQYVLGVLKPEATK